MRRHLELLHKAAKYSSSLLPLLPLFSLVNTQIICSGVTKDKHYVSIQQNAKPIVHCTNTHTAEREVRTGCDDYQRTCTCLR